MELRAPADRRLALGDVLLALAAGAATAEHLGVAVSLAIVDAGGVLKAFVRMDGAEIAGETLAVDKAFTAVAHRVPTATLGGLARPGHELFGLPAHGQGRYVVIAGGLPIADAGEVIGGVGVSGASAREDELCAVAVLDALQTAQPATERSEA